MSDTCDACNARAIISRVLRDDHNCTITTEIVYDAWGAIDGYLITVRAPDGSALEIDTARERLNKIDADGTYRAKGRGLDDLGLFVVAWSCIHDPEEDD